jgi:hypothetical protein
MAQPESPEEEATKLPSTRGSKRLETQRPEDSDQWHMRASKRGNRTPLGQHAENVNLANAGVSPGAPSMAELELQHTADREEELDFEDDRTLFKLESRIKQLQQRNHELEELCAKLKEGECEFQNYIRELQDSLDKAN